MKTKAVIFDVDGTLLDTEILYTKAIDKVLEEFGKNLTRETKLKMMGRDSTSATQILLNDTGIDISIVEFNRRVDILKDEIFKEAELIDGAEKLIRHLHKNKVPMSIATSSFRKFFQVKITKHVELFSLFGEHVTCGDDPEVKRLKPHPDIYLVAKEKLDIPMLSCSECLVFEDAHNGVKSGVSAEMKVVWIPDDRFCTAVDIPDDCHGAHKVLKSLTEFSPEEFGLPPYDD
ncbi:hypothetical protein BB559_003836 [Furculomyces boomerangus]|uniref:Uncharacterized protein n=2 Tax=Harpellales TaxID=61421 RepID=A0A2T9YIH8_9FUNG|nr:hypothetical protein BB559_003836 [Furculomyces boomerangus]PVZ98801.1 hypothetical protein BB558_005192 [Smittium angustum]